MRLKYFKNKNKSGFTKLLDNLKRIEMKKYLNTLYHIRNDRNYNLSLKIE